MSRACTVIALVLIFASILVLGINRIQGYDLWWHLETGEYIVTTGEIPTTIPSPLPPRNNG